MKKLFIALFIVTCFSNAQCLKEKLDHNGLPPITQEGKNKLGFLLNGQPWTPEGFSGSPRLTIDMNLNLRNGYLSIQAFRTADSVRREQLIIGLYDSLSLVSVPQTFAIETMSNAAISYSTVNAPYPQCNRYANRGRDLKTKAQGRLTITKFDRTKRIISGTFHAKLSKDSCNDIVISDGRFDMKY